jgi:hypothetical protein
MAYIGPILLTELQIIPYYVWLTYLLTYLLMAIWLELRRLPQILFYVVARMVIFKSRNQLQKATRRKVTMLL